MSSSTADYTEEQQRTVMQTPMSSDYIPTEEERRVIIECGKESFWYRSVPLSMASVVITQALITKGKLSVSSRFGSIPKLAFAGFCGYMVGKVSYIKVCQEKFNRLENSPMAEALRQRTGRLAQYSTGRESEMSNPNRPTFESMFQPADSLAGQTATQTRDYGHTYNPDSAMQMKRIDDFSAPVQSSLEEEVPVRKSILYEDLRLKNRENYEVSLTQKAETLNKSSPEKVLEQPEKIVKKNIYGDAWEE